LKIKKKSEHTGNYYYGARYYTCPERLSRFGDPRVSVWLSVDPLADISPDKIPFHFVRNNPIIFIDPDGRTEFENTTTGEKVNIEDGMNQLLKVEDAKWNNLTALTHTIDGNNPSDEYNAFIVNNGGVGVPTQDRGGQIQNKELFIGFMVFKAKNEKKEVAAWEMRGVNGEESFIVQPWAGNEEGMSNNYKSTVESFGFKRSAIVGQYHTHPGLPPDHKRGLSDVDMRFSQTHLGIPVRSIYADGQIYEGSMEPNSPGKIILLPKTLFGNYGERIR
jgi:proteasome lid subunit RPN8/RPN11